MCGRFSLISTAQLLAKILQLNRTPALEPRYNIAPTQSVAAVRLDSKKEERSLSMLRWGLIPFWAGEISIGARMINAKSETVFEKPAFRSAIRQKRCLIPADGFYEWKKEGKKKLPYYIRMQDKNLFAFAGLWERWKNPEEEFIESCTILTIAPNELVKPIHNRMPVILKPQDYDLWLDTSVQKKDLLHPLFKPYSSEIMEAYPVSPFVNHASNDAPQCIIPYDEMPDLMDWRPVNDL